jgi:hypothetical protein
MSALSLAGACGTDDGGGGGGDPVGGSDSNEGGSSNTGATNSGGGTKQTGGMSTSDAGEATGGTADAAGAAGMTGVGGAGIDLCVDSDLNCEDDDNPCTEDECNPATGTCGIPRSGTSCDDGLYCNGDDTCDAGECTEHDGNPCGAQDCNEADDACECTLDEHCPADVPGNWGECNYASECIESAQRSRPVTTYSCESGLCVSDVAVEQEECDRDTDGIACLDDNLACTGVEKCKAGNCTGSGNPCKAPTPFCYNNGTPTCRVCTSPNKNGSSPVGCDDGQYCCSGACQTNACAIIQPTIGPTIINPSFASASP